MSEPLTSADRCTTNSAFDSQDMVDLFDDDPSTSFAVVPDEFELSDGSDEPDFDEVIDTAPPYKNKGGARLAPPYMQNREISWLAFNERVLDQGADVTVPLLERLNFISIFWSNLQEFFMVRVGSLTDLSLMKAKTCDSKTLMTPYEQIDAIYKRCHELCSIQEEVFSEVRTQLARAGVTHLFPNELSDKQRAYLDEYMSDEVLPFLSPQIINSSHPFPHLENGGLYVVVRLDEQAAAAGKSSKRSKGKSGKDKGKIGKTGKVDKADNASAKQSKKIKNVAAEDAMFGLIPLPNKMKRIIKLPEKQFSFILLEHAIEMYAAEVFSMYTIKHTNIICVTRNADIDISQGLTNVDDDYREQMKRVLRKRGRLAPVRLECERELSDTLSKLLLQKLDLKKHQVYATSVPLDMSYSYDIASHIPDTLANKLMYSSFTPQWPASLDRSRLIMEQIVEHDVLLSYPYESIDPFVQLLREAAHDPSVISIKITLYRLARQSHIAEALIAAAEEGKEVTALFELRARFDERNNIEWSQRFEEAGCTVIYGFRDFKVHSKICCITRRVETGVQYITQLGTGNYNEKTSRLYTDFSFMTADARIGRNAVEFFRNMALENVSDVYDVLSVAPLQIKQMVIANIDEQIAAAQEGKPCGLFFKTNSITDREIIEKISEASRAGVPVMLFVRGISCIVPGVEGYTDTVRVVSIVGRLLEHSRIYGFGSKESMRIYLSSADLMTRNMDKRVEIAWPVLNEELRQSIVEYFELSVSDTAKLRELLPNGRYSPLSTTDTQDAKSLVDSQECLIARARKASRMAAVRQTQRKAAAVDTMDKQVHVRQTHANTMDSATPLVQDTTDKCEQPTRTKGDKGISPAASARAAREAIARRERRARRVQRSARAVQIKVKVAQEQIRIARRKAVKAEIAVQDEVQKDTTLTSAEHENAAISSPQQEQVSEDIFVHMMPSGQLNAENHTESVVEIATIEDSLVQRAFEEQERLAQVADPTEKQGQSVDTVSRTESTGAEDLRENEENTIQKINNANKDDVGEFFVEQEPTTEVAAATEDVEKEELLLTQEVLTELNVSEHIQMEAVRGTSSDSGTLLTEHQYIFAEVAPDAAPEVQQPDPHEESIKIDVLADASEYHDASNPSDTSENQVVDFVQSCDTCATDCVEKHTRESEESNSDTTHNSDEQVVDTTEKPEEQVGVAAAPEKQTCNLTDDANKRLNDITNELAQEDVKAFDELLQHLAFHSAQYKMQSDKSEDVSQEECEIPTVSTVDAVNIADASNISHTALSYEALSTLEQLEQMSISLQPDEQLSNSYDGLEDALQHNSSNNTQYVQKKKRGLFRWLFKS